MSRFTLGSAFVDVGAEIWGPLAVGAGALDGLSCVQAGTVANRTVPNQIELKILMSRKQESLRDVGYGSLARDIGYELAYGTMIVSPGCSFTFCSICLPSLTSL